MISEIDHCLGEASGIGLIKCSGLVSPSFLLQHFISRFTKNGGHVVFCGIAGSESSVRVASNKLAIRVDQKQISFIDIGCILSDSLSIADSELLAILSQKIEELLKTDVKNAVIFDDVSALEAFGALWKVNFSRMLLALKSRMVEGSFVIAAMNDEVIPVRSDFIIQLSPVGTGFSKDVSAEVVINSPSCRLAPATKNVYHACIRDRSVKLFVPGAVRPLL